MKKLLPWLVGGITGGALSVGVMFFWMTHLPAQGVPHADPVPVPSLAIQYVQVGPALLVQNVVSPSVPARLSSPVRLIIPKINVDAAVEYVGLTPDGVMDITKSPINVAWFDLGPRPGEQGSAVIAGHYGIWKGGISAVFNNLSQLQKGDTISVVDKEGTTTNFIVRESRRYDPEADASVVFDSGDGMSHLNLITCDGVWDSVSQSYSKRLVVFADREVLN